MDRRTRDRPTRHRLCVTVALLTIHPFIDNPRTSSAWNPQFNGLNRRGFNFFGVWDPLYHAALNDARLADREVGIAP
jgi:hypothetical protein